MERSDRDEAYEKLNNMYLLAYEKYMPLKEYLWAKIAGTPQEDEIAEGYGIMRAAPRNFFELNEAINRMKSKHTALTTEGDERVAPQTALDALIAANTNMYKASEGVSAENVESAAAYDALHALFEEDTIKLRLIYQLAVIVLGKYNPKLMLLGFAPSVPRPGSGQPGDVDTFVLNTDNEPNVTFTWNKPTGTTSSQLVYSEDNQVWEVLLYDDLYEYTYNPPDGLRYYKVRVRNANGFSGWCNTLQYEPPDVPS